MMADSSGERPVDAPTHLTEPALDAELRRRGVAIATQREDHREQALVPRLTLFVTAGPDAGQRFVSTGDRMVVGTHGSCDVVLHDAAVSRFHCELVPGGKGVALRDLDSANGTVVDGVAIQLAYARSGSVLTVGRTQLRFETGGEPVRLALSPKDGFGLLVGASAAIRRVFAQLERAAAGDATVLLEGEPGTGKAAAAESIHRASGRTGPFVVVDCAAAPPDLLERELFGDQGALAAARQGTLFLARVDELPAELQPKLLRVLGPREDRSAADRAADARVVAATGRSLRLEVNARRFRSDLYHRLADVECRIPPLRERPEDLPPLIERMIAELGATGTPAAERLRTRDLYAELARHAWPGNVRELRGYVVRSLAPPPVAAIDQPLSEARASWTQAFEQTYLEGLLRMHDGNVASAARVAGIDRVHLHRLLWKRGLR